MTLRETLEQIKAEFEKDALIRVSAGYTYLKLLLQPGSSNEELNRNINLFLLVTKKSWVGKRAAHLKRQLQQHCKSEIMP